MASTITISAVMILIRRDVVRVDLDFGSLGGAVPFFEWFDWVVSSTIRFMVVCSVYCCVYVHRCSCTCYVRPSVGPQDSH